MCWQRYSRHCFSGGLLLLGLCQASGCGGGASSASPTPPTPPGVVANRAPSASGAIPKQTLTVGGNVARVDVAPYFSDPDGDTLAYAVVSSDVGIVSASVSGSIVALDPVGAGVALATVTATDSGGLSATQPITVTVRQADTPGSLPACRVGLVLHIGESCSVEIPNISGGDNRFHVTSDGRGCYGIICAGDAMNLSGFRASRQSDGTWRIDALPDDGGAAPDLVVESPEVSSSAVVPAASFTLSATVRNQGAGQSASTTLRYYRSSDATISTGDTEVGTDSVSGLSGGGSGLESVRLTAPASSGKYYYGACVEPVSGESDTGNNCSAGVPLTVTSAPVPDLVVESPEVSSSAVVPEASFTLSATVRNQGVGRSASTTLRYYRSSDSTISTGDTEVGTDSVSGLSRGGSGLESVRLTAPASSGKYYYGACVEPVSGESDTGNNCSAGVTLTVTSAPVPDLVVESPEVSSSAVVPEGSFTLSTTVRNQGAGRSDSTTLHYYRSADSTISTSDTEVGTDFVSRLTGGASGLESIRLTASSAAGTYYYGACVEPVSGESDTGNNCSAGVPLTVESGGGTTPDLVVEAPEVSSGTVVPEGSFTLSATVRNQGAERSASTTLRYYRSSDPAISTGDTEVGTDFVSRLAGGASGLESVRLTAPDSPGTFYYGACVEPVSGESDTGNNCSAGVPLVVESGGGTAPDLVVESPAMSSNTVVPEASFTLSATVRNQGAGRSASTTLRYYRSSDSTISTSDTEVGTDSVFGLSGGASGVESIRLTAPNSPGIYYYGACVEPVSEESDTANNCSAGLPLTVESGGGAAPDLVVESPEVSSNTVVPEASFTLSATVRNQGAGRSDSTTLRYYRSADSTISTSDTEVGTDFVSRLTGGASGLESIRLTVPNSPGTYYYGACVEPVSEESDTANNCSVGAPLTVEAVAGPDLVVESPEVSGSSVIPGAGFTLSATVRNQGGSRSASTTLRYYRSLDSTISTADTEEGTDSVFGLSAGRSGSESIRLTAPNSPGTYYYGACVQPVSEESDTGNNCSAGVSLTVESGGGAAPDLVVESPEVNSSTVVPEGSFTLSATVRNQGAERSASTTLRYYRSLDSTISTGDTEVGTDSVFGLSGGASGLESIRLTAPVSPGTYYYGACVEPVSGESDTANNCSVGAPLTVEAVAGAAPDLVVESPEVNSSTVVPEGSFTLSATVRNQGAERSASTTLRYYRSLDSTISTGDTEVGTDSVFGLSGGASGLESIRLTAPVSPGTYYYGACVEPVSEESDTGNNCSAAVPLTVEAVAGPDLVVESPEVSGSSVIPGAGFTLSATVRNQGGSRSASTTLRYYRSSDSTISTGDVEEGTDSVFGLSAGRSGSESIRLTAPNSPGTYYYGACVEPVTEESDTGNNCSAGVSLTVESGGGAPDLVAESPEASRTMVVPDGFFTLSATVRNQGIGPSGSTTVRYYRSSDSTISTNDTEVETISFEALTAGGRVTVSVLLRAPSSRGTYYYGACVDSVSGESDTGNNCSAGVRVEVGSTGPACTVGQLLSPGEFCTVVIPGFSLTDNRFRVTSDGRGCYEVLCVDGSLSLNGFVATKQSDGRWRIDALP